MRKQWFLLLAAIFLGVNAKSQSCAEIASNPLCAQTDERVEQNLSAGSFEYGCFEAKTSFSYLLTTGGRSGVVTIGIERTDCDYIQIDPITGTAQVALDSIFISLIQINPDLGACDTNTYINQFGCFLMLGELQTFQFPGLPSYSNFMVVIGSNHNATLFGDCSIKVWAFGEPLQIGTTQTPSFIFAGQEAQISVEGQSPGESVSWNPEEFVGNASAAVTNAFPTESTAFVAESKIGECILSDTIYVTVGDAIDYANAISPNGDNVNDFWEISGIQKFPRAEVNIYDRWGQNVFRSIGYVSPWDGTNRGKKLPTGSYYYVIELNSPVVYIEPYTGYISVMH
jgi:gliding motility-associated-like protein